MTFSDRFELHRLKVLADYLFGRGAGEALFSGEVRLERSKRTGRVRHVYVDGVRVCTFRPHDGMLSLSIEGARRLHRALPYPRLRVVVSDDAAPFVAEGRSVFAKHVLDADPGIRPGMEVLVVTADDRLLAVGRAALSGPEMVWLKTGIAVKVREGVGREALESERAEKADAASRA